MLPLLLLWIGWLAATLAWWPVAARTLPGSGDGGWAMARLFGWIVPAWATWFLAATFGSVGGFVAPVLVFLLLAGGANAWADRAFVIAAWRLRWRRILAAEAGFHAVLVAALAVRGLFPAITWRIADHAAEKFTDMAILASCLTTPTVPPEDAWFAGFSLNYYYFGHWTWAWWGRWSGVPAPLLYNVALAGGAALGALLLAALVAQLARGARWAVLGVLLVGAGGNPLGAWQLAAAAGEMTWADAFAHYEMWAPSRAIAHTITEFPAFSFLLGDLHAHTHGALLVLGMLLLVAAHFAPVRRGLDDPATAPPATVATFVDHDPASRLLAPGLLPVAHLLFLLGAMGATNSWDVLSSAVVLGVVIAGVGAGARWRARGAALAGLGIAAAVGLFLFFGPFWLGFRAPMVAAAPAVVGGESSNLLADLRARVPFLANGPTLRTTPREFLGHWGAMLALLAAAAAASKWVAWRRGWMGCSTADCWRAAALGTSCLAALTWIAAGFPTARAGEGGLITVHWLAGMLAVAVPLLLCRSGWDSERGRVVAAFAAAALLLALLCELLHLDDEFAGENARINTVFKVSYVVWPLLGAAAVAAWATASEELRRERGLVVALLLWGGRALLAGWLAVAAVYPAAALVSRARQSAPVRAATGWTLDGWAFVEAPGFARERDDYGLIRALAARRPLDGRRPRLLEASTGTYDYSARFVSNLGWIAWVGWQQHVWTWRGAGFHDEVLRRVAQVDDLYAMGDPALLRDELDALAIDVVVWGALERERYGPEPALLLAEALGGWEALRSGESVAYVRPGVLAAAP